MDTRRQVRKNDHRRFGQSEFTGCHHAAMTGNDDAVSTNQHRVHKAELGDRASDLRHLGFRMCAGIARVRDQPGKRPALDRVGKRHRHLVLVLRGDRAPGGNQAGNLGGNCTGRVTTPDGAISGGLPGLFGILAGGNLSLVTSIYGLTVAIKRAEPPRVTRAPEGPAMSSLHPIPRREDARSNSPGAFVSIQYRNF